MDAAAGTTLFTASGGVEELTVPFGASSNTALQTTAIHHSISPPIDMTGLTLTLEHPDRQRDLGPNVHPATAGSDRLEVLGRLDIRLYDSRVRHRINS